MFAKKTSAVVKARIGMKGVKVTALPTCYCANLKKKRKKRYKNGEGRGARCAP
jgi:hypothetical protein